MQKFDGFPMFQELYIALRGSKELYVENYKSLLDYNECCIKIQGKRDRVSIRGCGLLIESFTSEGIKIKGSVYSIEYEEEPCKKSRR